MDDALRMGSTPSFGSTKDSDTSTLCQIRVLQLSASLLQHDMIYLLHEMLWHANVMEPRYA